MSTAETWERLTPNPPHPSDVLLISAVASTWQEAGRLLDSRRRRVEETHPGIKLRLLIDWQPRWNLYRVLVRDMKGRVY